MSSRKRPGGAVDSRPARKRSRLLPSSAGGTSQTEPRDLEQSGTPAFEPAGEEVIDLTGDEVIDLTGDEVIDLTGNEVIDLTGEDVIDVTGEDVIDLTGDEVIDLTGDEVIDLTGNEVIDLTGNEVIDLTGDEVIDLTGEDVIDLTGEDVIDLTGEDVIDVTGEDVIDVTGEDVIDLTGEDVINLTGESSEVITISDDESSVEIEQGQQQPHLFRASENSAEPLARDDEEEPREDDGDWILFDFDLPYWSDEDSEDREQDQHQQHSPVSSETENSADLLARDDEEEPRDVDSPWPAGPASSPSWEDEDSEVWGPPNFFRAAENSAEIPARDAEEEPRENQGWPDSVYVARFWMHYYSDWWYLRRRPNFVRAEDNSAMLVMRNNEEEQRASDDVQPAGPASPPTSEDEDSEFLEVHEQERRNVTLNSPEQVDGPGNGTGANDAPVADSAPAEQGAEEEDTESSDSVHSSAEPGVVIRCPICMDFYSEIMQRGRQLVSTLCGHVFCSRCLPIALETSQMCPACRVDLSPELYHPIYL